MPTVKELRASCRDQKLKNYSALNKMQLIAKLNNVQNIGAKVVRAVKVVKAAKEVAAKEVKEVKEVKIKKGTKKIFGLHVTKRHNTMTGAICFALQDLPLKAIQIFTHGPRNQKRSNLNYEKIKSALGDANLYIHSSYPTNPWNNKEIIFDHTIEQFVSASQLNALGVVLHIPKILPAEVATMTKKIVDELIRLNITVKVILEMKAVKPGPLSYETPQKINALINELLLLKISPNNVTICIDTAHIYAGKAQITTFAEGNAYLDNIEKPEWVGLIHLNGNEYDARIRAGDKHAIPLSTSDMLWGGIKYNKSGCKAFVDWADANKIDCIIEIKDHHSYNDVKLFINSAQ